jgi:hypothetical protein
MTAKPADTAAISVVALPNAWDDAEEWEPMAESVNARVVPFPNADGTDAPARALAETARVSSQEDGRKRLGDLWIALSLVYAAAALPVLVFAIRSLASRFPRRIQPQVMT